MSGVNGSVFQPNNTLTYNIFGFSSIKELCKVIQIPADKCTCEGLNIVASKGNPDFCKSIRKSTSDEHNVSLVLPSLIAIVVVIALLGNLVVVWMHTKKVAKKSKYTYLITVLALCDIFFAIFILIYYIPRFSTKHWVYGLIGCQILSCATTLGAWVAIGVILIIALERFLGIVYPLRRGISNNQMNFLLFFNVVIAVSFLTPRITHLHIHPELQICQENWIQDFTYCKVYDLVTFICYSIAPTVTISGMYFMIFRSLKKSMLKCHGDKNKLVDARRLRSNKKTIMLLVAVLVAFVLCTFPNKIRWLILAFLSPVDISRKKEIDSPYFMTSTEVMYAVHLAINPLIYAVADAKFRKKLKTKIVSLIGRAHVRPRIKGLEIFQLN